MTEPLVSFRGVEKTYDGRVNVVQSLDLDIERGEFLTLLGPSGSGKITMPLMLQLPLGEAAWGERDTWRAMERASTLVTDRFVVQALDLERDFNAGIRPVPP